MNKINDANSAAKEIKRHFRFLFEDGFQVSSSIYAPESFGNWIVELQSEKCNIRFIKDRTDINMGIAPPTSLKLIKQETYIDIDLLIDYIYKKDIDIFETKTSNNEEEQLKRLSTLLFRHYDILITFVGNEKKFLDAKEKIHKAFLKKLKGRYPNITLPRNI